MQHRIGGIAVVALLAAGAACAQSPAAGGYPSRPIRIVVPFPPGSGTDIIGRAVGVALNEAWKQPIVTDNRPGAGGTIGSELVAKAAPDGYTLLLGNVSTLAIARTLYTRLPYDPVKDFAPITLITTSENVLAVHPSVPADSVKALIALAKAKPGHLVYGSSGSGTSGHLGAALFCSMAGVEMVHVPYKGSVPALTDLLAGQTHLTFSSVPTALPHIKAGRLRALAMTRLQRSRTLPDVPTLDESGLKGFEISLWQGLVAPAATPRAIVMQLNEQVVKAVRSPEMRIRFAAQGFDPVGDTPEAFHAYIKAEADKWGKVVKATGARAD